MTQKLLQEIETAVLPFNEFELLVFDMPFVGV
jgi:hypothetical protein